MSAPAPEKGARAMQGVVGRAMRGAMALDRGAPAEAPQLTDLCPKCGRELGEHDGAKCPPGTRQRALRAAAELDAMVSPRPRPAAPRVALYHRVSTLDQDPAGAAAELAAAARRLGGRVVLEERETGSGASNDRPGLHRVLAAARAGKVDTVIVWKLDRWGRSVLDVLGNLRELETAGCRFIASSQGLDVRPGADPMSRLLLQVLAAVAEFERDLVRDRTRLGMDRARRRGVAIGRPPVALPDVARVRELLGRSPRPTLRAAAAELGCSLHALRKLLDDLPTDTAPPGAKPRKPSTRRVELERRVAGGTATG